MALFGSVRREENPVRSECSDSVEETVQAEALEELILLMINGESPGLKGAQCWSGRQMTDEVGKSTLETGNRLALSQDTGGQVSYLVLTRPWTLRSARIPSEFGGFSPIPMV